MTKTTRQGIFQPKSLALAVALGTAAPAYAVNFNIGEIEGQFDSSMSIGASWAMDKPDMDLVGNANRGTGYTQTGDDGRLNFKRGETFSKIFKGVHDLELRYRDSGAFVRGKYWYDFELKDESRLHKDISDSNRKEAAQSSGAQILDAFVYHNYVAGDLPGTVRFGKQVVSWGESTFIGNSINSINPLDAAAFRRPGAEIKEGLIPVNMLYVSQSLSDRLNMEAFYQLEWDQTIADNCGTFFSGADFLADGCTGYDILPGGTRDALIASGVTIDQLNAALAALAPNGYYPSYADLGLNVGQEGVRVRRGSDNDARDSGQFGFAFRWLGDSTEYGLYFMNYHSRNPFVSYRNANAGTINQLAELSQLPGPTNPFTGAPILNPETGEPLPGGAPLAAGLTLPVLLSNGEYFVDYPEDIRLYGASFSTTLPTGTAWAGELSYRPNAPVQLNGTYLTGLLAAGIGGSLGAGDLDGALVQAGQMHRGYNRKEITQFQTSFTHFFDQVLGSDRVTVVGELGYVHVGGLESKSELRYGRDSIFGLDTPEYGNHGFVTRNAWGYRLRAIADYSNVFAGINLKPNLSFSHDVDGYGPNGLFNEGSKAVSIGLDAEYQNMYTASLSYTDFFGGDYNTLIDRDFLAFSVGVNF